MKPKILLHDSHIDFIYACGYKYVVPYQELCEIAYKDVEENRHCWVRAFFRHLEIYHKGRWQKSYVYWKKPMVFSIYGIRSDIIRFIDLCLMTYKERKLGLSNPCPILFNDSYSLCMPPGYTDYTILIGRLARSDQKECFLMPE